MGLFNNWLIHKNCTTHYFVCSENEMQVKQNFWTMERAFQNQETFTVSQLYLYYKPAFSESSRFLSRSGLCVIFYFWTDKFKNKDVLFIYLLFPYNTPFFPNFKIQSSILVLLKIAWNNILTQNGQIQKKMLNYYINKIKRNSVGNTEWHHKPGFIFRQVSLGFEAHKVNWGMFSSQYFGFSWYH